MDAKEARIKAERVISFRDRVSKIDIEKSIELAVKNGKLQCSYYKNIEDDVKEYFESLGYTVKYQDELRNEFSYLISW
jgi:hypothetical protein